VDERWEYLGDGVYIKVDPFGFWLHANSHDEPTDKIYLEWIVFKALKLHIEQIKREVKNDREPSKI
jgi:hypothetical protein